MSLATAGEINRSSLALEFVLPPSTIPTSNRNLRNLCNLRIFSSAFIWSENSALDSGTEHTDNQFFEGMDKHSVTPYFLQWI
jgi:hypothetical protein